MLRVMSRFDFKDTSERGDQIFPVYNKVDMEKPEADRRVVAHVRLTRMALFNMRNEFYYFPRVKDANYEKTTIYLPGRAGMEFGYDEVNKSSHPYSWCRPMHTITPMSISTTIALIISAVSIGRTSAISLAAMRTVTVWTAIGTTRATPVSISGHTLRRIHSRKT